MPVCCTEGESDQLLIRQFSLLSSIPLQEKVSASAIMSAKRVALPILLWNPVLEKKCSWSAPVTLSTSSVSAIY